MKLSEVKEKIDNYFDKSTATEIIRTLESAGVSFMDNMPDNWVITEDCFEKWYNHYGENIDDINKKLYPNDGILAFLVISGKYFQNIHSLTLDEFMFQYNDFNCDSFAQFIEYSDGIDVEEYYKLMVEAINLDTECKKVWYNELKQYNLL